MGYQIDQRGSAVERPSLRSFTGRSNMIALRKLFQVFGRGTLDVSAP